LRRKRPYRFIITEIEIDNLEAYNDDRTSLYYLLHNGTASYVKMRDEVVEAKASFKRA